MSSPITRILSDFHYTDPGTWVERLSDIKPLLAGVQDVVMNGDTLDPQAHPRPTEVVAEVKDFFAHETLNTRFIAGNHDPEISPTDELLLSEGRVWVTHGHIFFDDIVPWFRFVAEVRRQIYERTASFAPGDFQRLEIRFPLFRQLCLTIPRDHSSPHRGTLGRLHRMAHALIPPQQFFRMVKAWRSLPPVALAFARSQRPQARVVITGHTHHPGIWRAPDGRVMINTGSFCPPRGGRLIDLIGDRVVVRRIVRKRGEFHPGPVVAEIALAPTGRSALSASP